MIYLDSSLTYHLNQVILNEKNEILNEFRKQSALTRSLNSVFL